MSPIAEELPGARHLHPADVDVVEEALTPPSRGASLPVVAIALMLLLHSLYLARDFFVPVMLALMLQFVLSPVVRRLGRAGLSAPVAAGVVVFGALVGGALTVRSLWGPLTSLGQEMPELVDRLRDRVSDLREGAQAVVEAAESVGAIAATDEVDAPAPPLAEPDTVVVTQPSTSVTDIMSRVGAFLGSALFSVFMLFFLLSSYDSLLRKVVELVPDLRRKKAVVHGLRSVESHVSKYLLTITFVNACLGCAVGIALHLLGLPNAHLWGIFAAFANFIPYAGALAGVALVGGAAFLEFSEPIRALAVPLSYAALTTLEGMLITPAILGKSFTLSPAALFAWLAFWSWMWGIPGALIAVPLLVVLKITLEHVPATAPYARLLA